MNSNFHKIRIPSFSGFSDFNRFWNWIAKVDEFFEWYEIQWDKQAILVARKFKGYVVYWWDWLQNHRIYHGKKKIRSWPKMRLKLIEEFCKFDDKEEEIWGHEESSKNSLKFDENDENVFCDDVVHLKNDTQENPPHDSHQIRSYWNVSSHKKLRTLQEEEESGTELLQTQKKQFVENSIDDGATVDEGVEKKVLQFAGDEVDEGGGEAIDEGAGEVVKEEERKLKIVLATPYDSLIAAVVKGSRMKNRLIVAAPPSPCQSDEKENKKGIKQSLRNHVLGIGITLLFLSILVFGFWYKRRKLSVAKSDLEGGHVYFEVPIFSYSELEKATNKFDHDKELGNGGYGAVYLGKLHDGREVAVKRLYQRSERLEEHFMNEVKILTRLRHKNLVSLYGCTSSKSHELLLVYEFIPNGTVADHLHGKRANPSLLTWPIRMSIAIETASALAYLHASDIIHRDVKTNNILLDNNFSVKVADFGVSRLFPNNVSHISTAPQGTFGYIDPHYFLSFQLTIKSDVYAFGVVLLELLSSMPAIDTTRHSDEIGLTNLARNKIKNQEFDKLIDPQLEYQSDNEVGGMITLVARLAFQCLQEDREKRPTMEEALDALKRIESGEEVEPESEEDHDFVPLKKSETLPTFQQ